MSDRLLAFSYAACEGAGLAFAAKTDRFLHLYNSKCTVHCVSMTEVFNMTTMESPAVAVSRIPLNESMRHGKGSTSMPKLRVPASFAGVSLRSLSAEPELEATSCIVDKSFVIIHE